MKLKSFILSAMMSAACISAAAQDTLSVFVIGDVMMHTKQLGYDCHYFLDSVKGPALKADIAVANLDFPLGGEPYTGYPVFSTPDYYADYIADCGFDIFLMANNHLLDKGEKGLSRTLDRYRAMSGRIRFTGAASDPEELISTSPLIVRMKGMKIAFINATQISNAASSADWPRLSMFDEDALSSAFCRAKAAGADFIVVLPHWGTEYELHHDSSQEGWARWFVRQGADVILGAHPHVVQDTTHIKGVPVVYSMGNAISNMSAINTRLELAVTLRFVSDGKGKRMLEPKLRWMWCTLPDRLTESYATIYVDEWKGRRDAWKDPSDYDNMISTLQRVRQATGIKDEKDD